MVEDTVEDDTDPAGVGLPDQFKEEFVGGGPFPSGWVGSLPGDEVFVALGIGAEVGVAW